MSKRHQELNLKRMLALKECFAYVGLMSIPSSQVEHFIKHLLSKGYRIVEK